VLSSTEFPRAVHDDRLIEVNIVFAKHTFPIVNAFGTLTVVIAEQLLNASSPIDITVLELKLSNKLAPSNAESPI
jgi:hypothetical protein